MDNFSMTNEQEEYRILSTLNYLLKISNGKIVQKAKKNYIKPFEYLSKYLYAIEETAPNIEGKQSGIIWQCWLQGEENMPQLVKVCTKSVKEYNPNREVILITEKNYSEYINIPEYIINKYNKGIIQYAHFADIIRLMLLEKYGGVWIDSTIYETGELPTEVFSSDFFTYKNTLGLCFDSVKNMQQLELLCNYLNCSVMLPSTWFISSVSNNIIISDWLKLLLEYWKNEDVLVDYFIMDYFFVLLLLNKPKCRQIFKDMPSHLTTHVNILLSAISEEFNDIMFENIKLMSPIHKLTLKYAPSIESNNRFYNRIIQNICD